MSISIAPPSKPKTIRFADEVEESVVEESLADATQDVVEDVFDDAPDSHFSGFFGWSSLMLQEDEDPKAEGSQD